MSTDVVTRLRTALLDAIEEIEDMMGYVPDYFREKWGYDESLAALKAVFTDTQPHPCGHEARTRGCGGCDPGAVEFVIEGDGRIVRCVWPAPPLSPAEQAVVDRFEATCQTCYLDIALHPVGLRGSWVACAWAERLAAKPLCNVCDDKRLVVGRWVPSGAERDAGKTGTAVELPCPSCDPQVPR